MSGRACCTAGILLELSMEVEWGGNQTEGSKFTLLCSAPCASPPNQAECTLGTLAGEMKNSYNQDAEGGKEPQPSTVRQKKLESYCSYRMVELESYRHSKSIEATRLKLQGDQNCKAAEATNLLEL